MTRKSGFIKFKSQQEINKNRREKTIREYEQLQKQIESILKENHQIAHKVISKAN